MKKLFFNPPVKHQNDRVLFAGKKRDMPGSGEGEICQARYGHRTHQTLTLLIITSGELGLNATRHFNPSQIPSLS